MVGIEVSDGADVGRDAELVKSGFVFILGFRLDSWC